MIILSKLLKTVAKLVSCNYKHQKPNSMKWITFLILPLLITSCSQQQSETSTLASISVNPEFHDFFKKELIKADTQINVQEIPLNTYKLIQELYSQRSYLPIWTTDFKPNSQSKELIVLLNKAQNFGLDTSFYNFGRLKQIYSKLQKAKDQQQQFILTKDFELLISNSCFNFMSNLQTGVLHPDTIIYDHKLTQYPTVFPKILNTFITHNKLTQGILDLQPQSRQYQNLQKALEIFLSEYELTKTEFHLTDPKTDSALCYEDARQILMYHKYLETSSSEKPNQISNYSGNYYQGNSKNNTNQLLMNDSSFIRALKNFHILRSSFSFRNFEELSTDSSLS